MEPTNQTQVDKDFDALKAKIPFDPEDKKPEPTPPTPPSKPEEEKPPEKPEEKKKDDQEDPSIEKKPDVPPAPPVVQKKPSRPERYIPVAQYTDEKKKWKETDEQKDKRIAELEVIAGLAEGSKKLDEAVKKYAEKHGVDEEEARAHIESVKDIIDLTNPRKEEKKEVKPEESKPTLTPEQQKALDEAAEIKAENAFNGEFATVAVPQLKSLFPNATEAQLAEAKTELKKLATTTKYLDKDLDYIAFKEKDSLSDIFATEIKGPEGSRPPKKGAPSYTSQDFENGKTPFSELAKLPAADQDVIIKALSSKAWDRYIHWSNQNADLDVS